MYEGLLVGANSVHPQVSSTGRLGFQYYNDLGYVDTFREVRHEAELYSLLLNRGQARAKNVGWRIDYHACSPDWKARTVNAWVYKEEWFSDHAPVIIDYKI